MPTVQQILNDVKIRLPYSTDSFTDGTLTGWMNELQNQIWRYCASTEQYTFDTIAGQALYTISDDMKFDKIKSVQISDSTTIDGTEGYNLYTYAGVDDDLDDAQWYKALGQIGIYPTPSTADGAGYRVKITYEPAPTALSTDTLTAEPDINDEYHDIFKYRLMKVIAQSGNAPDVELANNFQREENDMMKMIRHDYYKRKQKLPRTQFSYKQNWWNG